MQVGIVGKPNVGKSTFFRALTLAHAEIANYPFTTIDANRAVGYVRVEEPALEFGLKPQPRNSFTLGKYRFVPVEVIDVAGLVPGAHEGRGLGNKFLDELRQADVLIHVVDASGSTDAEGKPVKPLTHNPCEDVRFLEEEVEKWFFEIFRRNWDKISRRIQMQGKDFYRYIAEQFSGLGITQAKLKEAVKKAEVNPEKPASWSEEELLGFVRVLRKLSLPMVIAANKIDIPGADDNLKRLREEFPELPVIPVSAMAELMLRQLSEENKLRYIPGEGEFEVISSELSPKERKALEIIEDLLRRYGSTGVQQALNQAVFDVLGMIVVFPVENETRLTDRRGAVLPDAFLLPKGSTPKDLAFKIHTDIGEHFISAYDVRKKMRISADKELENGDIIKIFANA